MHTHTYKHHSIYTLSLMRMDLLIKYVSPHTRIHTLPQDLLSKVATLTAAHEDLKGKHGPLNEKLSNLEEQVYLVNRQETHKELLACVPKILAPTYPSAHRSES